MFALTLEPPTSFAAEGAAVYRPHQQQRGTACIERTEEAEHLPVRPDHAVLQRTLAFEEPLLFARLAVQPLLFGHCFAPLDCIPHCLRRWVFGANLCNQLLKLGVRPRRSRGDTRERLLG